MSNKVFDFINLHNGEEEQKKVLENIKSNISFRGSNLWILACAIVIASVGLNVNSTAVIIGAMLISPLMSPIVGAGFALAIYDFELLKKSGKNLLIATIVSLVVASIYFFISPFKETQSELLARTSPNIYDVLIAFFGGLVGVIALTRVEKGNPIPGVAIATALMPPLCTAGYGLAIGNFSYFFGAFYLYSINCFFICISTFLIVKYLKYEPVRSLNPKFEKQIRYGITSLILIMIIPSFYLAYNLLNEKKYAQKVEQFAFIGEKLLAEANRHSSFIIKKGRQTVTAFGHTFPLVNANQEHVNLIGETLIAEPNVPFVMIYNLLSDGVKVSIRSHAEKMDSAVILKQFCRSSGGHHSAAGGLADLDVFLRDVLAHAKPYVVDEHVDGNTCSCC